MYLKNQYVNIGRRDRCPEPITDYGHFLILKDFDIKEIVNIKEVKENMDLFYDLQFDYTDKSTKIFEQEKARHNVDDLCFDRQYGIVKYLLDNRYIIKIEINSINLERE
jgi:hypothetical protein